jgi:hypothetical protein
LINLRAWSNAFVNQPREEAGVDDEIAKFGVKGGRGLGGSASLALAPIAVCGKDANVETATRPPIITLRRDVALSLC